VFDAEYFNLGYLDSLSYGDSPIHRLDPRAKLIAAAAFIVTVVSYPKYEIQGLLPFFLFPALVFAAGDIPVGFIMKKVLVVSSFAVFIGIFNPVIDRHALYFVWGVPLSGGWISFVSIMVKFFLTVTAALLLIATTSFPGIGRALRKLGMPEIFVSQLLFLYRYLFVLTEETMRLVRARDMRSFGKKGRGMRTFAHLTGTLFLRTVERAERIYQAMLSRGFSGTMPAMTGYRFSGIDAAFVAANLAVLYLFRTHDVVGAVGRFSMRIF
jgi:cobalt/nickel transport system permease protein